MKKLDIKKMAALGTAALTMSMSLTACGEETTWGATVNGEKIPAGVFIYYLDSSNYEAQSKYNEENPAQPDAEGKYPEQPPLYTCTVEGKTARDWVYDNATEEMRTYAAIESKFKEYGLALTQDERDSIKIYTEQMWGYAGEYYGGIGISDTSYQSIIANSRKKEKLFDKLYNEGGEYAVPDSDIKAYLDENYAMINFIEVELRDGEGNLLKSDGKAERLAMLNSYISRYNNGEDFDTLNAEYVTFYNNLKAEAAEANGNAAEVEGSPAQADRPEDEDNDNVTPEETEAPEAENAETEVPENEEAEEEETEAPETEAPVTEATTEATTTAAETEASSDLASIPDMSDVMSVDKVESNKTVIEKDGTSPCKEVAEKAFSMEKGSIEIVETADGEYLYLVLRMDILEDKTYFEAGRDSLLKEMKSDEFDGVIKTWVEAQNFEKNQKAYDRYDPVKIFGK